MIKKCSKCGKYCDAYSDIGLNVRMPAENDLHKVVGVEIATISFTLCTKCASETASFIDDEHPKKYITKYPESYDCWFENGKKSYTEVLIDD